MESMRYARCVPIAASPSSPAPIQAKYNRRLMQQSLNAERNMMMPSLFLSHGAPTLPLTDAPARAFLSGLGDMLIPPKAILVVSAHWETAVPTVSAGDRNETIHDFRGFQRALYELRYPSPGSPAVAARVVD